MTTDPTTQKARLRGLTAAFLAVLGLAVVVTMVAVLYTVMLVRGTQLDNRSTLETAKDAAQAARDTADRIQDCTEPTGECFQQSQRRTAETVGDLNKVIVLAAACALGVDSTLPVAERQTLIQECVIDRLAAGKP